MKITDHTEAPTTDALDSYVCKWDYPGLVTTPNFGDSNLP